MLARERVLETLGCEGLARGSPSMRSAARCCASLMSWRRCYGVLGRGIP